MKKYIMHLLLVHAASLVGMQCDEILTFTEDQKQQIKDLITSSKPQRTLKCPHCSICKPKNKNSLRNHILHMHTMYVCNFAPCLMNNAIIREFVGSNAYYRHKKEVHTDREEFYACTKKKNCRVFAASAPALRKHNHNILENILNK